MIRNRVERLLGESGEVFTREVFQGDEEIPAAFWRALTAPSLFAEPKAVVLRRADAAPDEFWPKLRGPLAGFSAHVWPMICLEKPFGKKGPAIPKALSSQPYYQVAEKRRWIWTSPGLTRRDMAPMLKDWAGAKNLSFAPGVLDALAAVLPEDMAMAGRELEKLELAVISRDDAPPSAKNAPQPGRVLTEDLSILAYRPGMDAFAFLNAFSKPGQEVAVWREIFEQSLSPEDMIFKFLGLLRSDARQMWQIHMGEAEAVRLPPFVKTQKEAMARRLGPGGLTRLFDLAMDAEMGIKSGAKNPDQAMEFLAAELFSLFSR
ncbi:DNA polymerase III subunit delta [Desulfolutivibrio sulfoxidireducens]|uniref:DNA polymerase III subunit delta n=1 Tax=Desulfolutivibrio sulfoxidireducens TaxID=2773299 RepID=UPI001FE924AB|nr:DNA polymerase III subunit delta [Desulfolutivibrio sulfoxidireducens]